VIVAIVVGVAVYFGLTRWFDREPGAVKSSADSERQFRNVFAIMDETRRQSLIRFYMEKHECSREEAMRRAVDDRERETGRWA
jgi:hypothetical protein